MLRCESFVAVSKWVHTGHERRWKLHLGLRMSGLVVQSSFPRVATDLLFLVRSVPYQTSLIWTRRDGRNYGVLRVHKETGLIYDRAKRTRRGVARRHASWWWRTEGLFWGGPTQQLDMLITQCYPALAGISGKGAIHLFSTNPCRSFSRDFVLPNSRSSSENR
ncbi:hypothetical protein J6590_032857 [Homalodisca vitripennis]|nr:hypothetical protein J6590_032857 [Homalodisca vitripennis]